MHLYIIDLCYIRNCFQITWSQKYKLTKTLQFYGVGLEMEELSVKNYEKGRGDVQTISYSTKVKTKLKVIWYLKNIEVFSLRYVKVKLFVIYKMLDPRKKVLFRKKKKKIKRVTKYTLSMQQCHWLQSYRFNIHKIFKRNYKN